MQIQIGQMVFLTSEKWASDQSQVIDEIFDQWKHKYGFFCLCGVGFAKVNESKCQQCLLVAYNCRIMTSGLKQEVSCWCKQVKLIYEDNVREGWIL